MTKTVVFDWNGTLLDDFDAMHSCMNAVLEKAGRAPMTPEDFRAHYDVPFDRMYRNLGIPVDEIEAIMALDRAIYQSAYEHMAHDAGLREGALEVFQRLGSHAMTQSVETIILSNHIEERIRVQLERLRIAHHFSEILAFESPAQQFKTIGKGERLDRHMKARSEEPTSVLVIGDSVEEIEIARAQKFISVAITGGCVSERRLRAAKPDYLIHGLFDLVPIMQERGFFS